MFIKNMRIPLDVYTEATEFTVVGQTVVLKYVDNKPTEEVESIKLELHDASKLKRFEVKIPGDVLPFKDETVENHTIKVSLVNAILIPYFNEKNKRVEYSVKADSYKEVKKA